MWRRIEAMKADEAARRPKVRNSGLKLSASARAIEDRHDLLLEVDHLRSDNTALTNALQRIEMGQFNPQEIARSALDSPAHRMLFG